MSPKSRALIFASLAALPFAAGATAPSDPPAVHVQFADLDLSHDAGVERLYARLRRAATTVCSLHADIRDLRATELERTCVATALDRAVADVHSARLSARHALGAATSSIAMLD